jgi:hypothetical protein
MAFHLNGQRHHRDGGYAWGKAVDCKPGQIDGQCGLSTFIGQSSTPLTGAQAVAAAISSAGAGVPPTAGASGAGAIRANQTGTATG